MRTYPLTSINLRKHKKTILFVPQHAPSMLAMLPVAERVRDEGEYRPLFFLLRKGKFEPRHYDRLEGLDISWVEPGTLQYLQTGNAGVSAIDKISAALPASMRSLLSLVVEYRRLLQNSKLVLQQEQVRLLVLMGDRHVGWETSLVKQANRRGVPSLVVPFAASGPGGGALYRLGKKDDLALYEEKGFTNRLAARLFPEWIYEYHGKRLLFYPGSVGLVAWMYGIMPARPWALIGGGATCAAVENKIMYDMFLELGVRREKMVVTGHPLMDSGMDNAATIDVSQKRREFGVQGEQRLILFAVPNLAEHALLPWDRHMAVVESTIEKIRDFDEYKLVLNLHPRSKREKYEYLEKKYDVVISPESIYSLIPLSDVYLATHSGTVMQAIGFLKPTIVLDYFDIGEEAFGEAPGVIVVKIIEQPASLSVALARYLDRVFYAEMKRTQSLENSNWVALDSHSTDRVMTQVCNLTSTSEPRAAA